MLRLSFTHFAFPCYLQINIWTLCEIKFIKSVFVSPKLDQSNAYNCRKDSFSSYYQSFILKRIFNQSGIISNIHMFLCENILDPAFTQRVLSNCPCLCVRPSNLPSVLPSLNISETAHWSFLIFCMKLGHHKRTKVSEPDFWGKNLRDLEIGKRKSFF